jgi:hypothetical protein
MGLFSCDLMGDSLYTGGTKKAETACKRCKIRPKKVELSVSILKPDKREESIRNGIK